MQDFAIQVNFEATDEPWLAIQDHDSDNAIHTITFNKKKFDGLSSYLQGKTLIHEIRHALCAEGIKGD